GRRRAGTPLPVRTLFPVWSWPGRSPAVRAQLSGRAGPDKAARPFLHPYKSVAALRDTPGSTAALARAAAGGMRAAALRRTPDPARDALGLHPHGGGRALDLLRRLGHQRPRLGDARLDLRDRALDSPATLDQRAQQRRNVAFVRRAVFRNLVLEPLRVAPQPGHQPLEPGEELPPLIELPLVLAEEAFA